MDIAPKDSIARLAVLLSAIPQVKFAYLFGSHARGDLGLLSDLDVGVYIDARLCAFRYRLRLMEILCRELGTDRVDLVILNDSSPVLQYEVIRHGWVLKEDRKRRIPFEARTLGQYLDTEHLRRTQQAYLKEQFRQGEGNG